MLSIIDKFINPMRTPPQFGWRKSRTGVRKQNINSDMKIRYSLIAIACAALVGCMDKDWNDPNNSEAYGNPSIKETNVITISELKNNYANVIASQTDPYKLVENNIQIKGRITGNDIQGNIYNSVCLEDATGGILINIAQGGLFGYLPVGQEIIVNLKDLFVGSYGQQAAIGTPFTNGKGQTSVSRMNRYLWNEHFNYAGSVDVSKVQPEVFDVSKISDAEYLRTHSGRLMTIKDVKFKGADGKKVFATAAEKDAANSVNRELEGFTNRQIVVRTSTYADFAAQPLPQGTVDITGIFTRFRNTWQILLRTESDVKK